MKTVSFKGIIGPILFDSNGDFKSLLKVDKWKGMYFGNRSNFLMFIRSLIE